MDFHKFHTSPFNLCARSTRGEEGCFGVDNPRASVGAKENRQRVKGGKIGECDVRTIGTESMVQT